jgi:hypothetical protein
MANTHANQEPMLCASLNSGSQYVCEMTRAGLSKVFGPGTQFTWAIVPKRCRSGPIRCIMQPSGAELEHIAKPVG